MKIIIISDGKYGDRAVVNIKRVFPATELVILPEYDMKSIIDEVAFPPDKLPVIKSADLLINYHRHPDVAYELAAFKIPMIQAIYNGEGFLREIQEKFGPHIIMPSSMCAFNPEIDISSTNQPNKSSSSEVFFTFFEAFGVPKYVINMRGDTNIIEGVRLLRQSPCGSTMDAVATLRGKELTIATLNEFALQIRMLCRESVSYILNRHRVEENAAMNHLLPLLTEIKRVRPLLFAPDATLATFMEKIKESIKMW